MSKDNEERSKTSTKKLDRRKPQLFFDDDNIDIQDSREVLTDDRIYSILESILFFSDRPVTLDAFKCAFEGTNINLKKIKNYLSKYEILLAESNRGIYLEQIASGYQLRTKQDNTEFLNKIKRVRPFRLSPPSLEVLAIIAYEQPCVKARLDEIRAVDSSHLLRSLMDKGLVAFYGKSDLPGKPMLYKTTKKFLEVFGLKNLKQLPPMSEIDNLLPKGTLEEMDKEEMLPPIADLSEDLKMQSSDHKGKNQEDYEKTEKELKKITEDLMQVQIPQKEKALNFSKEDSS